MCSPLSTNLPANFLSRKQSFSPAREGLHIQVVLTAPVIYHLLALDLDPWVHQLTDRIRRGFLWAGKEDVKGGHCLVAWHKVCQPKALGGLGLHKLRWLGAVLRARWLWFQRTSTCKPWLGLDLSISQDARALFRAGVKIAVGTGQQEDPWVNGLSVDTIAPAVVKLIRPGTARRRTVQEGLRR
jgi:hypothetical protein